MGCLFWMTHRWNQSICRIAFHLLDILTPREWQKKSVGMGASSKLEHVVIYEYSKGTRHTVPNPEKLGEVGLNHREQTAQMKC
jgi:hypothetical protein